MKVLPLLALALFAASAQAAPLPACFPQGGFTGEASAKNARELQLKGSDSLLLAGIDIPDSVAGRAKTRMDEIVAGHSLRYVPLLAAPDRYGRIPADIAVGEPAQWLQGLLVEEGFAVAMPLGIKSACSKELLFLENQARQKKAGIWSQANVVQLAAADKDALLAAAGKFTLVEGKILNVGKRDYATFLNFGPSWKHDFAVIVVKKDYEAVEAVHPLSTLTGKRVRVRGILQAGAAPRMSLKSPEALEILE